ncbi:type IV pilus assembly protein PilA [Paenibacillus catalpae]|uniref:Type IV pilus assembly protein PilA n=1 Tax=Paenibacillus catalpae TaxID=1045775 RepID=A0A1I2EYY9_9BACL|nr:type II secretion system protein [Paenibacillus catalpae]SFE97501.1 type IV pilus assembly protein PilA [Paenibacillus catalpae]
MLKKAIKRLKKEEKGFTLIELLAVIVILAVIAVIAVPLIGNIIENTREKSDLATARQIYDAARLWATDSNNGDLGNTDITLATLQGDGFLDAPLYLPSTKDALDPATTIIDVSNEASGNYIILSTGTGTADDVPFTKAEILAQ